MKRISQQRWKTVRVSYPELQGRLQKFSDKGWMVAHMFERFGRFTIVARKTILKWVPE